jgi:Domain of unknown function (DUF4394)/PEP-CTERM motif
VSTGFGFRERGEIVRNLTPLAAVVAALAVPALSHAVTVFGLSNQNQLFSFDSAAPGVINSSVFVTGLQSNELLMGIDIRPSAVAPANGTQTGTIYALGSSSRLYTVNPTTGAATAVGGQFSTLLNGTEFGFDFNPTIDRIRVVSDTDQNLVLNPNDGSLQLVATPLSNASGTGNPNVVGSAYTNSFQGSTTTQLYGIDSGTDFLVTQNNNGGVIANVGPLGVTVSNYVGFDIGIPNNTAYMSGSLNALDTGRFYTVNLATGLATDLGEIGGGLLVRDITVAIPEPTSLALLGGVAAMALRRRGR